MLNELVFEELSNKKMKTLNWVLIFFPVIALFVIASSCDRSLPAKPNIILIMADDLGYECLGCNGGVSYKTPVLDELAASGIRYTSCFSQPLCTPSRVQIMTGKYNHRNYTDFGVLKPGEITFAHLLKDAGYATGVVGKWQLYGSKTDLRVFGQGTLPADAGFDEYCLWQIDKVGSRYADPVIHWDSDSTTVYKDKYGPDIFFKYITGFLEKYKNEPFFLYYPMVLPHDPHVPTPLTREWNEDRYEKDDKYFTDMVNYMDKNVGRIVERLEELSLRKNTILIFTGDNGTNRRIISQTKTDTIKGNKGIPVFYGTHVPMIVNGTVAVKTGLVSNDLIDFSDFLPSICELAGIDFSNLQLDGVSFVNTFKGKKGEREWVYCYYDSGKKQFPFAEFIQNQNYKLYGDGSFFDIMIDPGENCPLEIESLTRKEQNNYLRLKSNLIQISK